MLTAVAHFRLAVEAASINDLTARFRAPAETALNAGAIARRTTSPSALG